MDDVKVWLTQLQDSAGEILNSLIGYLPNLLGAVVLLFAGWLIARLARSVSSALTGSVGVAVNRLLRRDGRAELRLPQRVPGLVGDVVFWIIILFFVTAAARTAQLDIISIWLERIVSYLPTLVSGLVIVFVGYLLSALVRDVVTGAAWSAGFQQSKLIGTAVQAATFLTACVIGLDQIGIDVSFLIIVIAIVLATSLGGLSLAFGLGARRHADNLINARSLRAYYQRGQVIRIGDLEGEILEFTPTAVVIAGKHGRTTIPARRFATQVSILVTPEDGDE